MARPRKRRRKAGTQRAWRGVLAAGVLATVGELVELQRRGYRLGGHVVVRCRQGHLFTTIWIPGASLKSIRLGWWRIQRCPAGHHWSLVTPVSQSELTEAEQRAAGEARDIRVP